jgi:hypothetical protein
MVQERISMTCSAAKARAEGERGDWWKVMKKLFVTLGLKAKKSSGSAVGSEGAGDCLSAIEKWEEKGRERLSLEAAVV